MQTVFVGDFVGIATMLITLITNRDLYFKGNKNRKLFWMIIVTITASASDILAFVVDEIGSTHPFFVTANYILNTWLYLAVIVVSYLWMFLLCECIGVTISRGAMVAITVVDIIGAAILLLNCFFPIIFSIENGVYQRKDLYWLYVAIGGFNMIHGMSLYYRTERKGGVLVSFSLGAFFVPLIVGVTAQSIFYGVSVIWVGVSIAISGMVSSMKNELILIDQLTGIYNRYYLEKIKQSTSRKSDLELTGIMIDLNKFKDINDKFGHKVGDEALVHTANILVKAVGTKGKVIRYAGDEFVVILFLNDQEKVNEVINKINGGFEDFNGLNMAKYKLSAAMGCYTVNFNKQSIDGFINTIDAKMYENKSKIKAKTE